MSQAPRPIPKPYAIPARLTTHAPEVLRIAAETIISRGAMRDTTLGDHRAPAERNMAATVAAFNALEGTSLSEVQGWRFMATLKLARAACSERNDMFNADDYVDGAAYNALAHEAAERDALLINKQKGAE